MQHQYQQEEEEKPVVRKVYTQRDLLEFEPPNMYSSIGKMNLSHKPSAPIYGFGTSDRKQQAKVFRSKELSTTQFVGKTSPGPAYEVRESDKFYYSTDPKWSFGKNVRNTLNTGPKHAHYLRQDVDFDPMTADVTRRWRPSSTKIGLASRFTDEGKRGKGTPGPEYDPGFKPHLPNQSAYTFGVRRATKGHDPLVSLGSTPHQVGPGSYLKLQQINTSTMPDQPQVSFPKDRKMKPMLPNFQKNQTYDTRSAFGPQVVSNKKTMGNSTFGKAKRDASTGIFRAHLATQPTRIRIQHPRF